MRITRHNGRSAKNTAKHNDRDFDVTTSDHIREEALADNLYWDYLQGLRRDLSDSDDGEESALPFEEVEQFFYAEHYQKYADGQNRRNELARHPERNKSTTDLLHGKRTQPEETILQVGNIEETISLEELTIAMQRYQYWFEKTFGSNVHIIDWALHADETTPHIQERHVFDFTNQYGEVQPMQEKALEALGIERPDPDQPKGRHNCRKMTFDKICREKFIEIIQQMDIEVETEPIYGGRKYLEKQDYIIATQKERIAANETRLEELTAKTQDIEKLISSVTDTAYERAVGLLTEVTVSETMKLVDNMIRDTEKKVSQSGSLGEKAKQTIRHILSGINNRVSGSIESLISTVRKKLLMPSFSGNAKAAIKDETRKSVLALLKRKKDEAGEARSKQKITAITSPKKGDKEISL